MKKIVFETLLDMQQAGIFSDFVLGGSVAYTYYVEPIPTNDVDFFVEVHTPGIIVSMQPIFDYMAAKGLTWQDDHIIIDGVRVNVFPTDHTLYREAMQTAITKQIYGLDIKVISPEYLICTSLLAGRAKDWMKIEAMLNGYAVDSKILQQLIAKHHLEKAWRKFLMIKGGEVDPSFNELAEKKARLRQHDATEPFEAKMKTLLSVWQQHQHFCQTAR